MSKHFGELQFFLEVIPTTMIISKKVTPPFFQINVSYFINLSVVCLLPHCCIFPFDNGFFFYYERNEKEAECSEYTLDWGWWMWVLLLSLLVCLLNQHPKIWVSCPRAENDELSFFSFGKSEVVRFDWFNLWKFFELKGDGYMPSI